jgi:hypothetical protein
MRLLSLSKPQGLGRMVLMQLSSWATLDQLATPTLPSEFGNNSPTKQVLVHQMMKWMFWSASFLRGLSMVLCKATGTNSLTTFSMVFQWWGQSTGAITST